MKVYTLFTFVIFQILSLSFLSFIKADNLFESDTSPELNELIRSGKPFVILFSQKNCQSCQDVEQIFTDIVAELKQDVGIEYLMFSEAPQLEQDYGITTYPSIVYIREKVPALYSGSFEHEEIVDWLIFNKQPLIKTLNDQSFEHLTQASTGATTGDWLVSFFEPKCVNYIQFVSILEGLYTLTKQKLNVAKVNVKEGADLVERLKIKSCPSTWLFRHGKMYPFEIPPFTIQNLKSFSESWYQNVIHKKVPQVLTPFDRLTDTVAQMMKESNGFKYLIVLVTLVIGFLSMVVVFVSKPRPHSAADKDD